MWIGDRNKALLIDKVWTDLCDDEAGANFTLVIPPGFGQSFVPRELGRRVRCGHPDLPLAFINCDSIRSEQQLFSQLYRQWCPNGVERGFTSLSQVVAVCRKERRRLVLVLSRFHTFLQHIDSSVLTDLRDAEQANDIRTVVCCIYHLSWIKREWRQRGHALLSSDYGDVHTVYEYEPVVISEICEHFGNTVPRELLKKVFAWAGGVPEFVVAIVKQWQDRSEPALNAQAELQLRRTAIEKYAPISRQLDETNESRFLDVVVDMWLPPGNPAAARVLQSHPWARFLLCNSELASEGVGESCFRIKSQKMLEEGTEHDPIETRVQFAKSAYERGQFLQACEISSKLVANYRSPESELLALHSEIMSAFGEAGVDVDWKAVGIAVRRAEEQMPLIITRQSDRNRLNDRYQALAELSEMLIRKKSDLQGSRRIVDVLARDHSVCDATLAILYLAYTGAVSARGNTEAITRALAIPEQIFRVWALWSLQLDYECVPTGHEVNWATAAERWRALRGNELDVPSPGQAFPGFLVFAFFVVALLEERTGGDGSAPMCTFDELAQHQFLFEWRNDPAHSLAVFSRKSRDRYLKVVEDWLACLCAVRPSGKSHIECLRDKLGPLPLLQNGTLRWPP